MNQPYRPAAKQPPAHAPNAALLIDFDNVTMGIRSDLQQELRRLMNSDIIRGKVAVQRAYADWRRYPQYIVPLSEASIDLIFAPAFGSNKKNATDIRLAIDALELIFTRPEIGTFILLSGDSDFSSMVIKLKEYGKYVIGVGIRESASDLLIQNCDEYYSYNELAGLAKVSDEQAPARDPWELVVDALLEMRKRGDVMRSDRLKQVMQEMDPAFDEKNAGMSRFSKFVEEARRRGLLVATIRLRFRASSTNFENRFIPTFFSSNDGSISCITCLSRSERITSPRLRISSTASTTSSHGSRCTASSSPTRVRPASSLYEKYSSQFWISRSLDDSRIPTPITYLPYSLSLITSELKSESPESRMIVPISGRVNTSSTASIASRMSVAVFLLEPKAGAKMRSIEASDSGTMYCG